MRDYGRISTGFWAWADRMGLDTEEKLLAAYLMSTPHSNVSGVFCCPIAYIAEDLGNPSETVSKGFRKLSEKNFARYCERTKTVFMVHHLRHQPPENQNVGKSLAKAVEAIPTEFAYWAEFLEVLAPHRHLPEGFLERMQSRFETVSKPFRNPEPEPEPEPGPEPDSCAVSVNGTAPEAPPEAVIRLPLAKQGEEAAITAAQISEWEEAYPGVDIHQALRNMRQWCLHNPTKRKTARGIGRFITSWLAREQDSPRPRRPGAAEGMPEWLTEDGRVPF